MNKRILEITAFAGLAVFAVVGWMHRSASTNFVPAAPIVTDQNPSGAPVSEAPSGTTASGQPPIDSYYQDPYSSNRPVYVRSVGQAEPLYGAEPGPATAAAYTPEYANGRRAEPGEYAQPQGYRHGRSTKRSVALVAGSAGVGAAIGALAGGGKGAGIGALAGGGAGFVYDRLTHKTHTGF